MYVCTYVFGDKLCVDGVGEWCRGGGGVVVEGHTQYIRTLMATDDSDSMFAT